MNSQKHHWDKLHDAGQHDHYIETPSEFAQEVLRIIRPSSKILELGCGVGNDSIAFANAQHSVIATDFSEVAIKKNIERFHHSANLSFQVVDMNDPMSFSHTEFDVIYARLSLHYFSDTTTRRIFSDMHTLLKPQGYLCFMCKSTEDPLYGKGTEIEKDMFEYDGHVRHFFSDEYTRSLLNRRFEILKFTSGEGELYGSKSAYIQVIAKAKK